MSKFFQAFVKNLHIFRYLKKIQHPRLKVIKNWCREILGGIEYLHSQKPSIIHRDLKCENIFINSNLGEVKIGDLGLATHIETSHIKSVLGKEFIIYFFMLLPYTVFKILLFYLI